MTLKTFSQNWESIGNGISDGYVRVMYTDTSEGKLYVGGNFNNIEQMEVGGIACWSNNKWDSLSTGIGGGATPITAITKYKGAIYAGVYANNLYKWENENWEIIPTNGPVLALHQNNDTLFVGGWFDTIAGVQASKMAFLTNNTWSSIDTTIWYGGAVNCITEYKNNLYIGGNFWNYNGSIMRIAKWNGSQ